MAKLFLKTITFGELFMVILDLRNKVLAHFFLFILGSGVSVADEIYLSPVSPSVSVGSQVSLDIWYNFTNQALGGAFDIWFGDYSNPGSPVNTFTNGSGLSFVSYTPNAAFGAADPYFFTVGPTLQADHLDQISIGGISGLPTNGPEIIGTLVFAAGSVGNYYLTPMDNPYAGGFIDTSLIGNYLPTTYTGAVIQVTSAAAVPVPGAAYLFATGFSAWCVARRRKQSVAL
jgi:hypothetical protein